MSVPRRIRKPMPMKGLVTSLPADSIGEMAAANAQNVRFRYGQARKGPGRKKLSDPISDVCRNIGIVTDPHGQQIPYMLTDGGLWTRGANIPGIITGAWTAVPQTSSVYGTGAPINSANKARWAVTVGEGYMFFTRNQKTGGSTALMASDSIKRWDMGMTATGYQTLSFLTGDYIPPRSLSAVSGGGAGSVAGRFMEYMNSHLVIFNVVEQTHSTNVAAVLPQRIRWSKGGDHLYWDDSQGTGAGFIDLWEGDSTPIQGVGRIRDDAVIVRGESIGHFRPTYQLQPEFIYETRVRGFGTRAPYSVASNGTAVFFLGTDNIVYSWDGATLAPIGGPIQNLMNQYVEPLTSVSYTAYQEQTGIVGICSVERSEYWLIIVDNISGNASGARPVFIWDWVRQCWSKDSYPDLMTAGPINTGSAELSNVPGWFGGGVDGRTFAIDENYVYDDFGSGFTINSFVETEDIYFDNGTGADPWNLGTVIRVLVVYDYQSPGTPGQPVEIGVSTNRGSTYITKNFTPVSAGYSIVDLGPITGNVVRFRFRENDGTGSYRITSYSFEFIDAGEYIGTTT